MANDAPPFWLIGVALVALYLVALFAPYLIALFAPPAHAEIGESGCGPRAELAALLADGYGERPVGRGLKRDGILSEIFVSPAGSWSQLWTWPSGQSCIMDAGSGWQAIKPGKEGST